MKDENERIGEDIFIIILVQVQLYIQANCFFFLCFVFLFAVFLSTLWLRHNRDCTIMFTNIVDLTIFSLNWNLDEDQIVEHKSWSEQHKLLLSLVSATSLVMRFNDIIRRSRPPFGCASSKPISSCIYLYIGTFKPSPQPIQSF